MTPEDFGLDPMCAVCGKTCSSCVLVGDKVLVVPVCFKCKPLRRCGKRGCLGLMVSDSTPNDMSRFTCDKCGTHKRM